MPDLDQRRALPYAKPDVQRRYAWWKVSGSVILICYAAALITLHWRNAQHFTRNVCICTAGLLVASIG